MLEPQYQSEPSEIFAEENEGVAEAEAEAEKSAEDDDEPCSPTSDQKRKIESKF